MIDVVTSEGIFLFRHSALPCALQMHLRQADTRHSTWSGVS